MTAFSWQVLLFGLVLIIIGWFIAAVPSETVWLYPAIGLSFVGGGVLSFIAVLKD